MRPIFFAPWWWFVLSGGKRFSLRRGLALVVTVVLASAILFAGAAYAFHGTLPTLQNALPIIRRAALASGAYWLLEPLTFLSADCLRARSWCPDRLRNISSGMQLAYAVAFASISLWFAPHIAPLARLLARAHAQSGPFGGNARYLIGATIVMLPCVVLLRMIALRVRPAPLARGGPVAQAREPIATPPIASEPVRPPIARAARIVGIQIGPADPKDAP